MIPKYGDKVKFDNGLVIQVFKIENDVMYYTVGKKRLIGWCVAEETEAVMPILSPAVSGKE